MGSEQLHVVDRKWQQVSYTSLLFSLQQARAGTGLCRLDTSAFILDSALLVPLKPQVSSKQKSLWSVKGTTRITWDTRLRTCFNELFWCKASDVYFDQYECGFKCIILTNTVLTWPWQLCNLNRVTLCCYGVQEKPEIGAEWDWTIWFPFPKWRSKWIAWTNKQVWKKKKIQQ